MYWYCSRTGTATRLHSLIMHGHYRCNTQVRHVCDGGTAMCLCWRCAGPLVHHQHRISSLLAQYRDQTSALPAKCQYSAHTVPLPLQLRASSAFFLARLQATSAHTFAPLLGDPPVDLQANPPGAAPPPPRAAQGTYPSSRRRSAASSIAAPKARTLPCATLGLRRRSTTAWSSCETLRGGGSSCSCSWRRLEA